VEIKEDIMSSQRVKKLLRPLIPAFLIDLRRRLYRTAEIWPITRLKFRSHPTLTYGQLTSLTDRVLSVDEKISCAHTHHEIADVLLALLAVKPETQGCIVEAGCFKGGSTAKLSLLASLLHRRLFVFDSFEGIPEHHEAHTTDIFGERAGFPIGSYCGRLEEVEENIRRYGVLDCCDLVRGWFEDTLPSFSKPVALAFIDVDLASSTRTCLRYLYPLLVPGGTILSHDGHLPLCIEVFRDVASWAGSSMPIIEGLGTRKLITIRKPL
jgi:O-methyltransferase